MVIKLNFRWFFKVWYTLANHLTLQLRAQNSKFQKSVRKLSLSDENWHTKDINIHKHSMWISRQGGHLDNVWLTWSKGRLQKKRKKEKEIKERSHKVRWKDIFPYHKPTLSRVWATMFKSVCPDFFLFCFYFSALATVLSFASAVL